METLYLGIVVFLFLLAIFDLMVGVSNDAVNFLSSAVGARVASFRTILIIAAAGVLCGAALSNGMMEIARHGIFRPEYFTLWEVMCIFLAVMVADVFLLDLFNTLGLPTSTTVSMVFELLGGAFALALVKSVSDPSIPGFAELLNTEKALSVIMAIFVSVAIAFLFGAVVQWLARLVFTFNYRSRLKWTIGLFGGVALTAIVHFILIKGLKGSPLMTPDVQAWIDAHTAPLMAGCLVLFTAAMQVLHWCRVNVFKVVVLMGTFALAMAFAGNDLVNFIGVPLAGFSAYTDYAAHAAGDEGYLMTALNGPAKTPFVFLFAAGCVMIFSLFTSKKARRVIQTSVDLSRQDEGEEMFGSSAVARSIVRTSMSVANAVVSITPPRLKAWINARFAQEEAVLADGAAFDLVRASVNLLLASLLIALGTSLKLPLSTTYVTFMVAMGTSLADRAWGRESAVFRITGVLSVIGGWFITAGAAFAITFFVALAMYYGGAAAMVAAIALTIYLLLRSHVRYSRKLRERAAGNDDYERLLATHDPQEAWELLRGYTARRLSDELGTAADIYRELTRSFVSEDHRGLQRVVRLLEGQKQELRRMRRREMLGLRRIDRNTAIEKNTWVHLQSNCCEQIHYALRRMCDPCKEHVDNNFAPLSRAYRSEFIPLRGEVANLLQRARAALAEPGAPTEALAEGCVRLKERITQLRHEQLRRIHDLPEGALKTALVYLNLLQESQELVDGVRHLLRANEHFNR